ncbi:hypothetical protein [Nitrospira sp. M1]
MDVLTKQNGANTSMAPLKQETYSQWNAFDAVFTKEDISNGIEWSINDDRHAVIVHLGGTMSALETELDGRGKSFGPANSGEIWIVPAGARYASRARGGKINYGVVFLKPERIRSGIFREEKFSHIAPLHGHRDDFCFHAVRKLIECLDQNDDTTRLLGESISQTLSLHLFREYGGHQVKIPPQHSLQPFDNRSVRMLQEYIYDHISEEMTLAKLSTIAGMTTHNF